MADLFSHADSSYGVGFSPPFVCVSVFPHDVSKTDATRLIKLS